MEMRWSHEGVSLRAPVRNALGLKRLGRALLGVCAVLTAVFFAQLAEPTPVPDYAACVGRANRHLAQCEAIRPSFETWDFQTLDQYVHARACSLGPELDGAELVTQTRAHAGVAWIGNLDFLRMAAHQSGACPLESSLWRDQAEREWDVLVGIEQAYWTARVERETTAAREAFERASFVRDVLQNTVPLWLPALLGVWLFVLVVHRRLQRAAEPLELHVHTGGCELDGRRIPRSDIAFLSIEGQCLRVERWSGPPIHSRALPAEALVHADEICGALGLMPDDDTDAAPAPAALHALLGRRVPTSG